ncbi:unnamed protein product [Citrullus colocynthis]|uniref:Uncharacterized protein n=1 Tax=Citrullus colocynthis TaxID=252529 RepID=A0ABP0Y4U5_9ROSI
MATIGKALASERVLVGVEAMKFHLTLSKKAQAATEALRKKLYKTLEVAEGFFEQWSESVGEVFIHGLRRALGGSWVAGHGQWTIVSGLAQVSTVVGIRALKSSAPISLGRLTSGVGGVRSPMKGGVDRLLVSGEGFRMGGSGSGNRGV